MPHAETASFRYAVFSFLSEGGSSSVPVGVVLWSPGQRWVRLRLAGEGEHLEGLDPDHDGPIVRLVHEQVSRWMATGHLPHLPEPVSPHSDRWWRHARELLIPRVRLSEPHAIDCGDPGRVLTSLYEATVRPQTRYYRGRQDGH